MDNDKRRYKRVEIEETVQVIARNGDLVLTVKSSNLSNGGALLVLPPECILGEGETVVVKLLSRVNEDRQKSAVCSGSIVRHTAADDDGAAGMAVMFDSPVDLNLEEDAR